MLKPRKRGRGRPLKWVSLASAFIEELQKLGYSESWIRKVKNVFLTDGSRFFNQVNDPAKVSRNDYLNYIEWLVDNYDNADYRRQKLSALNIFLSRYENYVYQSVRFKWERWEPKNIFWLTRDEVNRIWDIHMSPPERAMIWMESRLGARRIEVIRQRRADMDLNQGYLYLRGKGGFGTRGRRLPVPLSGYQFIPEFDIYRERCLESYQKEFPGAEESKEWIIYWTTGKIPKKLTTLKPTMADHWIERISERSGIQFTAHVLRISFARHLYDTGIPSEVARKFTGHSSVKMFERYVGIDQDDLKKAIFEAEKDIIQEGINKCV